MSKKKKLTPNQDKYKELRNRLKRKVKDLGKRGYMPNKSVLLEKFFFGDIPEKVSKKLLQTLEALTKGDNIYDFLHYYSPLKDKYITGRERRKEERQEAARKGWESRRTRELEEWAKDWAERHNDIQPSYTQNMPSEGEAILKQVRDMIDTWKQNVTWTGELLELKTEDKDQASNILEGAINKVGLNNVLFNLQQNSARILALMNEILFQSGNKYKVFSGSGREGMRVALAELSTLIYGRPLTVEESIELTNYAERINEAE